MHAAYDVSTSTESIVCCVYVVSMDYASKKQNNSLNQAKRGTQLQILPNKINQLTTTRASKHNSATCFVCILNNCVHSQCFLIPCCSLQAHSFQIRHPLQRDRIVPFGFVIFMVLAVYCIVMPFIRTLSAEAHVFDFESVDDVSSGNIRFK